jgi:hypothetical protein
LPAGGRRRRAAVAVSDPATAASAVGRIPGTAADAGPLVSAVPGGRLRAPGRTVLAACARDVPGRDTRRGAGADRGGTGAGLADLACVAAVRGDYRGRGCTLTGRAMAAAPPACCSPAARALVRWPGPGLGAGQLGGCDQPPFGYEQECISVVRT